MTEATSETGQPGEQLLALYDRALPTVYGYLYSRTGDRSVAEDLTAEVFLAAVDAVGRDAPPPVDGPWLVGVARHKLIDHWRRCSREERKLEAAGDLLLDPVDDADSRLDVLEARRTLAGLGAHHRTALVLRYVDGLSVPEVAATMGRTRHATEALIVRARAAFRRAYAADEGEEDRDV